MEILYYIHRYNVLKDRCKNLGLRVELVEYDTAYSLILFKNTYEKVFETKSIDELGIWLKGYESNK